MFVDTDRVVNYSNCFAEILKACGDATRHRKAWSEYEMPFGAYKEENVVSPTIGMLCCLCKEVIARALSTEAERTYFIQSLQNPYYGIAQMELSSGKILPLKELLSPN